VLFQQRSAKKTLQPGGWDVSFTIHVYPGESYGAAAARGGIQEFEARIGELSDVYSFVCFAPQGKWSENEFCGVRVCDLDGKVKPNPDETKDIRWITVREVEKALETGPYSCTSWLRLAFEAFLRNPISKKYGA